MLSAYKRGGIKIMVSRINRKSAVNLLETAEDYKSRPGGY